MRWFKRRAGPKPDLPISFGYKTQWLAAKHPDPVQVAAAAGLHGLELASWTDGLSRSMFVTPVLDGWVLAVGFALPDAGDEFLRRLSGALHTRVCHFGSHRGVDLVSWGMAEDGELHRLYTYADGQTLENVGAPMPEEITLGIRYPHELGDGEVADAELDKLPGEDTVLTLAGLWSIDPMTIEEQFTEPSLGWSAR